MSDVGEFRHFMENRVLAPPVVLIVAGCIVFLVASLGCYGALRESYLMLMAVSITFCIQNSYFILPNPGLESLLTIPEQQLNFIIKLHSCF